MNGLRLGLLVRADQRGLGCQLRAIHRWLQPAKTLLVDMGELGRGFALHPEWYPDARLSLFDGKGLDDGAVNWITSEVDLVFSVETMYDFRIVERARERGVRTAALVNPEFYRWGHESSLPRPDALFAPTTWRLDQMPGVELLPQPIDRSDFPYREVTEVRTVVHVGGNPAHADRNGTRLFIDALRYTRRPVRARLTTQSDTLSRPPFAAGVEFDHRYGDLPTQQELYDGADALVLPRRYGGLSLPMLEAASIGLPIISLDLEPQRGWLLPDTLVGARSERRASLQGGKVDVYACNPRSLAAAIDSLVSDPELVARAAKQSDTWAEANSWETLLPVWQAALEGVAA